MFEGLFDQAPEPKQDFVLFDESRGNYIFRQQLTMTEAVEWTLRLAKSFCPHLKWQKTSAEAISMLAQKKPDNKSTETAKTRAYVIRRN
jgi:hypothetical protein